MTLMEDNINGKRHKWKTNFMKDNHNERWPQWKMTSIEETSIEDNFNFEE